MNVTSVPWRDPEFPVRLSPSDVHVWRVDLERSCDRHLSKILSEREKERAEKFYFKRDRDRFIVGRGMLKKILGLYVNRHPADVSFLYNPHGKPHLLNDYEKFQFNMSHSNGTALYSIAKRRKVGIDVEYLRNISDVDQLGLYLFSEREKVWFNGLQDGAKLKACLICWTQKEAFAKAMGIGHFLPLSKFEASPDDDTVPRILSIKGGLKMASRWSSMVFSPAFGYLAAMVVEGEKFKTTFLNW